MSAVATDAQAARSAPETKVGHALIVDDDEALCSVMSRFLVKLGYDVVTEYTGAAGLERIRQGDFDVALFDVHLPDANGQDLLVAFKDRSPESSAVMLTADGSLDLALQSIRSGASDFITKPFHLEQLAASLDRAFEHRKLRDVTALYRASHAIFATRELEKLPEVIVEVSMRVMSADSVSLFLPGIEGQLYLAHSYGLDPAVAKAVRVRVGEGVAGRVAQSLTPLILQGDARAKPGFESVTKSNGSKSSIVYPLVSDRRLVGMLTFNRTTQPRPFRQSDLEKAGVLASQVLLSLETTRLVRQNLTSEKLAAVGQLAAGIAHEINTPIQFVGDSVTFLERAVQNVAVLLGKYKTLLDAVETGGDAATAAADIRATEQELDIAYDLEQMPLAVTRTLEGVGRVAEIVHAMKAFAHPDQKEKSTTNINQVLQNALTVARNEYKYIAEISTHLEEVPPVLCHVGEIGQVFLVLIVNASHAMAETAVVKNGGKGALTLSTSVDGDDVVITFVDTGGGIPVEVRERIFEPFFTTKEVGKGTGLGLSIALAIVVEKHGGSLTFSTEMGVGTTFVVRLPVEQVGAVVGAVS